MKKLLLSLAAVALGLAASAEESAFYATTSYTGDANYSTQLSGTVVDAANPPQFTAGDITIYFEKINSSASNVQGGLCRWYANDIIHIIPAANCTITNVIVYGTSGYPSAGSTVTSTPTGAKQDGNNITWSGSTNEEMKIACSKQVRFSQLVVTYTVAGDPGDNRETATLSFPSSEYSVAMNENFTAPELTVDPSAAASEVVYASSNVKVATVDAKTGAVTVLYPGTTTISASITDSKTYKNAKASYTLNVTTGLIDVAQTIEYINAGYTGVATTKGIVVRTTNFNSTYGSITYYISDDGTTNGELQVYGGLNLNSTKFSAQSDIEVGATVVVEGNVKLYNSSPEFDMNNYLISYTAPGTTEPEGPVAYNAPFNGETYTVKVGETLDIFRGASYPEEMIMVVGEDGFITVDDEAFTVTGVSEGTVTVDVTWTEDDNFTEGDAVFYINVVPADAESDDYVDVLEYTDFTDSKLSSYDTYSYTSTVSGVTYKAQMATNGGKSFQFRSNGSNSGLVTIDNPSKLIVKSVAIEVYSGANEADIYGYTEDYTDPTQLYATADNNNKIVGEQFGALTKDGAAEPDNNYVAFGLRSKSGALYLSKITVTWTKNSTDVGVDSILNDSDAAPVYYNLQGVRVAQPEKGLYIVVKGGKSQKVIF